MCGAGFLGSGDRRLVGEGHVGVDFDESEVAAAAAAALYGQGAAVRIEIVK